jgi:GT2 family glycosyltransferase
MTANLLMRQTVIDRVGGFDERLDHPHLGEDSDLAWRAVQEQLASRASDESRA